MHDFRVLEQKTREFMICDLRHIHLKYSEQRHPLCSLESWLLSIMAFFWSRDGQADRYISTDRSHWTFWTVTVPGAYHPNRLSGTSFWVSGVAQPGLQTTSGLPGHASRGRCDASSVCLFQKQQVTFGVLIASFWVFGKFLNFNILKASRQSHVPKIFWPMRPGHAERQGGHHVRWVAASAEPVPGHAQGGH